MRLNTHRGSRQELGAVILTVTTVLLLTVAHKAEVWYICIYFVHNELAKRELTGP